MSTADEILSLVQAMNRAKESGQVDSGQERLEQLKKISVQYTNLLVAQQKETGLPQDKIIDMHMMVLAVAVWRTGLPYSIAMLIGVGLFARFQEHLLETYEQEGSAK